jgi:hypothetical protein
MDLRVFWKAAAICLRIDVAGLTGIVSTPNDSSVSSNEICIFAMTKKNLSEVDAIQRISTKKNETLAQSRFCKGNEECTSLLIDV